MTLLNVLELVFFLGILAVATPPLGRYLARVLDPTNDVALSKIFRRLESWLYRFLGVKASDEQDWKAYTTAMIIFSVVTMLFTYAILRLQNFLPFNPQGFAALTDHLSFNTAASFTTNTNWQSYGGESTLSYTSQMIALALHNFLSAAVGIAIAAAVVRGLTRDKGQGLGNFWVDLIRVNLYLLLPLSFIFALILVSQGMIQNFAPYTVAAWMDSSVITPDAAHQTIAQGPMASQVAIKMLGTNGGGFMNANAAHPFENPTPLSNFLQMLAIFLIPSALTYFLGLKAKNQKHGWAVWAAMATLFVIAVVACSWAESSVNPRLAALGIDSSVGNFEGKEMRFGIFDSSLFATITTAASCGAVNAMHDSLTPLGGLVTMVNMQLGEVVFGGVGAGLYGMVIFIVLAIFIAGLMVGRTPEYLGKKIEAFDIKAAALAILVPAICILGFTAWAGTASWGTDARNNMGPHGFSELLYAFTSATANNGSAFAGLSANVPWWNNTLAVAMLIGRFFIIIPVMALAGNMVRKKVVATSSGSFPVSGVTFTLLLVGTVLIVGALTFLPALALGPIVEHFVLFASTKTY